MSYRDGNRQLVGPESTHHTRRIANAEARAATAHASNARWLIERFGDRQAADRPTAQALASQASDCARIARSLACRVRLLLVDQRSDVGLVAREAAAGALVRSIQELATACQDDYRAIQDALGV